MAGTDSDEEDSNLIEAFTRHMNQIIEAWFNSVQTSVREDVRKEIRRLRPDQRHVPQRDRFTEPRRGWPDPIYQRRPQQSQLSTPPRREFFDPSYERRSIAPSRGKHEHRNLYQEEAMEYPNQSHLQQSNKLRSRLETQQNLDATKKQFKEALQAWVESEIKRDMSHPSSAKTTTQEPSCSTKETVDQRKETDQPLLVCKGMDKISSSVVFDNEIFNSCEPTELEVNLNLEEAPRYDSYDENEPEIYLDLDEAPKFDSYDESEWFDSELSCNLDNGPFTTPSFDICEEACESLTNHKPVYPSIVEFSLQVHEENRPDEVQKEPPIHYEPETIPKSLSYDLLKHCKEFDLVRTSSDLFLLVSVQSEKRFGLEKVKEFCVSGFVFDKMFQSFETLKHEEIFVKNDFLFDKVFGSHVVLNFNLDRKMFGNEFSRNLVFDEHFSKVEHFTYFLRNIFNFAFPKNVFGYFPKFDQVFKSFYDHMDMIHLFLPRESNAGLSLILKRERIRKRIRKGEEDNRFKPPDLGQARHLDVPPLILIKSQPPDVINQPMPSLNQFRGKSFFIHDSVDFNLFSVHADHPDSRTNPFQEGGPDAILTGPYDPGIRGVMIVWYDQGMDLVHDRKEELFDRKPDQKFPTRPEPARHPAQPRFLIPSTSSPKYRPCENPRLDQCQPRTRPSRPSTTRPASTIRPSTSTSTIDPDLDHSTIDPDFDLSTIDPGSTIDPLVLPTGPMTRARTEKLLKTFQTLFSLGPTQPSSLNGTVQLICAI